MFRSEIGSGFEDPGGTPPPRIPRSTPPPPGGELAMLEVITVNAGFTHHTVKYGPRRSWKQLLVVNTSKPDWPRICQLHNDG